MKPKCLDGFYYDWTDLECVECHSSCATCVNDHIKSCIQCKDGYRRIEEQCFACEELPGLYTNENNESEEICGDGILYPDSKHDCDD